MIVLTLTSCKKSSGSLCHSLLIGYGKLGVTDLTLLVADAFQQYRYQTNVVSDAIATIFEGRHGCVLNWSRAIYDLIDAHEGVLPPSHCLYPHLKMS